MHYLIHIYRGSPDHQHWDTFSLEAKGGTTIISALMEIERHPVTVEGKQVSPIVWESSCLEEVCGSCSMVINGKPRQACSTQVSALLATSPEIHLSPLSKFPLIRDLIVDRSGMLENLQHAYAWVEEREQKGIGPPMLPHQQALIHALASCMSCGCCVEACPQVNPSTSFVGAAVIAQAHLFHTHPLNHAHRQERLHFLMKDHGLRHCGNAQNCVKVCPKQLPLTDSIAEMGRATTRQLVHDLFSF